MTDRRGPQLNSNSQENLEAQNEESKGKFKGWLLKLLICIGLGVFLFFLPRLFDPTSGWQDRIDSGNPVKYEEVGDLGKTYYNELDEETGIRHVAWKRKHSPKDGSDYFSFLIARFKNGLMTNYASTSDSWIKVNEKFEEWNAHIPEAFKAAEAEAPVIAEPFTDPIIEKIVRETIRKPKFELNVADLEKVTFIFLNDTKITDASLKELTKLKKLEELYLSNTQITDAGLNEVAKLQKLHCLWLKDTKITSKGLKEVAKLQKLRTLNLSETKITDVGLKEVVKLQKLKSLKLNDTEISDEGVAELKKALPNCTIYGP